MFARERLANKIDLPEARIQVGSIKCNYLKCVCKSSGNIVCFFPVNYINETYGRVSIQSVIEM